MKLTTGIQTKIKNNKINVIYPQSKMNEYYVCFAPLGVGVQSAHIPSVRLDINEWFKRFNKV